MAETACGWPCGVPVPEYGHDALFA